MILSHIKTQLQSLKGGLLAYIPAYITTLVFRQHAFTQNYYSVAGALKGFDLNAQHPNVDFSFKKSLQLKPTGMTAGRYLQRHTETKEKRKQMQRQPLRRFRSLHFKNIKDATIQTLLR